MHYHRAPTYLLNGIQPASFQCQTLSIATAYHEYFKISHEYFFQGKIYIYQILHISSLHVNFVFEAFALDTSVGYV